MVAALFGGAGLKLIEEWLGRRVRRSEKEWEYQIRELEELQKVRAELREEVVSLRAEIRQVREELDQWRDKYYELEEMKNDLQLSLREAQMECERLRRMLSEVDDDE